MEDDVSKLKLATNIELIEKVESMGIDYVLGVKEALLRIGNKQFTQEEFEKFISVGEKVAIVLIDMAPNASKYDIKKGITDAISQVVDKAYDKNR